MPYILSLDEGTTSARAIVFAQDGSIKSVAQREFTQLFPKAGWVEHDPEEIWATQLGVAVEALSRARLTPADVAAVGIANQRETTIVWQDRRTADWCQRWHDAGHAAMIQERTGLLLDAYFSASKIAWVLDHVPGARARAAKGELAFGTVDSWLLWKLTSGRCHQTDASNAARTLLFNIHTGAWDDDLLRLFQVPREILPEVKPSSGVFGDITAELGLGSAPVAGIAGDQQAALFGQMCLEPGMAKNTYGTGCFMLQHTGQKPVTSRRRLLTTIAWKLDGRTEYALEGSIFVGGAVVQWLRDGLGIIANSAEAETLAASVPDNGGVYLVPAFSGLGAPHWDPYARGAMLGITRGTNRGHVARAALESIAFQVADLVEAMAADSGIPLAELRVDGGAAKNDLLLQFQSDLLGVTVARPAITETTALGAAYFAGLAVGYWPSPEAIAAQQPIERRFEPVLSRQDAVARRAQWARAVERAKHWETAP
jgi:glycerol kinase